MDAMGARDRRLRLSEEESPVPFETWSAAEIVRWAVNRWGSRLALVTSFQVEGMVLLDLALRADPRLKVITLDTGRLHQESHEFMDRVRRRFGVTIEVHLPEAALVKEMVRRGGFNLFYRSVEERLECCHVRKVQPMGRALRGLDAWMTGLRRKQSAGRAGTPKVERASRPMQDGRIFKLSPLADWTEEEVWHYTESRDLPVHPLYARGFRSIGCAPCSRAPEPGGDPRSGRWWWEQEGTKECGLHQIGQRRAAGRQP